MAAHTPLLQMTSCSSSGGMGKGRGIPSPVAADYLLSAGGGQRFRAETAEGVFNFAFAGEGGGRRLLVCCLVTRCFGTTGLRFVIKVPVLIPTRSCTEER